jgi:SAM-dependent methyltransferase
MRWKRPGPLDSTAWHSATSLSARGVKGRCVSTTFEASLKVRSAADYADFLLPYLDDDFSVLDVGCGTGTITLGLAETVSHVFGVDPSGDEFADARRYAAERHIENVEFRVGSVYALDFPVDHFDACLCHSMLETLDHPLDGLIEIKRPSSRAASSASPASSTEA